jgi:hypothetical protein
MTGLETVLNPIGMDPCGLISAAALVIAIILWALRPPRPQPPSQDDVRRVADLYRLYNGARAAWVLGDHMLGASFAPDGEHHAFLRRVAGEMVEGRKAKAASANLKPPPNGQAE